MRIEVDGNGRATGVTYVTDGTEYFQPARVVLLASYTYENSRLLLLSKSKAFPKGLSNNRGQVGRHYFTHEDVQAVAYPVLGHRLILRPEAEIEGKYVADVVRDILHAVPVLETV